MTRTVRQLALSAAVVAAAASIALHRSHALQSGGPPSPRRENAYRANNIGVAHLEQYDFAAGAAAFRQALQIDPDLAIARLNLGIALFYGGDADAARREIEAARPLLPDRPQPDYVLGLIARVQNRTDDAIDAFARVQRMDPSDPGAAVSLGQLYLEQRKYPQALDSFRTAMAAEPYNATAAYGLATAMIRTGDAARGRTAMDDFQRLRATKYATTYSQTYLEQGHYAEAIASTGAEPELVDERLPDVTFADATSAIVERAGSAPANQTGADPDSSPAVALADIDGDGDLDLVDSSSGGVHVYRNNRGRLTDSTTALFGGAVPPAAGVVAGDFDNDGRADLLLLGSGGLRLYKQDASGRFGDVTTTAGLPPVRGTRAAAWLDADHDGDLDLLVAAGGSGPSLRLFRNNGDGRFADITTEAGLSVDAPILAAIPTDYDNRRDIDILLVAPTTGPLLFRNLRDGTFRNVAAEVGLSLAGGTASAAAIGDVNKDGYPDFFFGRGDAPGAFALSDGRGRFTMSAASDTTAGALAAQFLDYDNDGLLDLLVLTARGPRLLRNLGDRWTDATSRAFPDATAAPLAPPLSLASGDLDGDGDIDVIVRSRDRLTVWRNEGGSRARTLRVTLAARVSNRSGIGTKIDARAGSLRQRIETYAATPAAAPADVVFGFGSRAGGDVVRVLWPSGILQAETAAGEPVKPLAGAMTIQELDRKPSSCPFLFTWNGARFEFITDFLGGGEMGYLEAPGERNHPDPDEYVRIEGDRLRPRDGRYELRITDELEEALFLDRAELVAIAHPRGVDVYPNEGLRANPGPAAVYAVRDARAPLAATDEHGHDVLDRISRIDRRYPDDFARVDAHAASGQRPPRPAPDRLDRLRILERQPRRQPARTPPDSAGASGAGSRRRVAHGDRRYRLPRRPPADGRRRSRCQDPGSDDANQDHDDDAGVLGPDRGGRIGPRGARDGDAARSDVGHDSLARVLGRGSRAVRLRLPACHAGLAVEAAAGPLHPRGRRARAGAANRRSLCDCAPGRRAGPVIRCLAPGAAA